MSENFETQLAAAAVCAEAGGEQDARAIPAVCEVIRNRIGKRWPDLQSVVLARLQFSCLNDVSDLDAFIRRYEAHPKFPAALAALEGPGTDFTHGATHYCRLDCFPSWAEGQTPTAVIEHHKFFRLPL